MGYRRRVSKRKRVIATRSCKERKDGAPTMKTNGHKESRVGHPMKRLLILTAVVEGLTGLILLVYPPVVIRLLFDSEIAGAGVSISRIASISLIALGVACWPDRNTPQALLGMLTDNLLATLYLAYVG